MTRRFKPLSKQLPTATSKDTAAVALIREIQGTLAKEIDSFRINYGYQRYIMGRCSHFIRKLHGAIKSRCINLTS